ncbi:EndoU domain-containing protein [Clostridium butyricum]|uniref:EndoU domain-containing protein n=1 Tax=Clostridium butyricum TaxID=1492 RepID=UPI0022E949DF|nr:EndoU domain-containing protein [Clostridium butyricum]
MEVSGEKVKLNLDIDETQNKDKAAWFRYAPPTGNLMYSMPIVGTNANLYFSSERSEDPVVIGCIRKNGSSCESFSDVNNRYFATESGNNLDMLPGAINFSRPGLSANFNDGSGINLSSSSSLNISAGYVGIYAGDITIKAKSKLEAKKGESSFISLENDFYNNAGIVMENGSDKVSNGAFDDDPQKGAAEAKKAKEAMESAVKVALAAVVGAVQGAMGKIGECLAGVVENQKGNVESQTNSNKSGEKSLLDSNNISDPLNLYSNKPWRNVDSNIKLPDNECYIGPANENALPIVSDELTMTEYDPYMKDFKDGMYVQNRAPDNRYYLGTITYNSDLNMAIYKPTDKKGFEQAKLEQDKKDIRTIASFAADWTPADVAIDSASFIAGHDIITGEDCNRGILAAGILLPGGLDSLGKGLAKKGVKQASKHGDDVAEEAFKIGDDVYDATKGVADPKLFKVSDSALNHSSVGDFTYNPKTGKVSKMKGGGHGQANIDFLDANGLKYEVVDTYPNGVRVGNVADHKVKVKRTGSNQSWFPESWTESDIVSAGEYVGNLKGNINAVDGVISYGEVNGVRVGVIRTNGQISTVFPDATIQP